MKSKLKLPLLSLGIGTLLVGGFAGTISGSLAWWAYSTRASITYQGTSVASSEQLQIGLKTDLDLSSLGMEHKEIGDEDYYFCDPGSGLSAEIIAAYLASPKAGGYATSELEPITTGSYESGDISLKNPLVSGSIINNHAADKDKYVKIPLAFRVLRYHDGVNQTAEKGENIWLSDAVVEASSTYPDEHSSVHKAIRMFAVGQEAYDDEGVTKLKDVKYLINPSDTSNTKGKTAVAGLLDISGNGFYDTYDKFGKSYNIVYGESNLNEAQLLALEDEHRQSTDAHSGIVNFNEVEDGDVKSTFVSEYYKGTYHPDKLEDIQPKYQNFETLGTVRPSDTDGLLGGGKPLCATDLTYGVANLDLTIWLEGWDHHVIDKENQHHFNLGLQFQITRL